MPDDHSEWFAQLARTGAAPKRLPSWLTLAAFEAELERLPEVQDKELAFEEAAGIALAAGALGDESLIRKAKLAQAYCARLCNRWEEAMRLVDAILPSLEGTDLARAHLIAGAVLSETGRADESLNHYSHARKGYRDAGDKANEAASCFNSGLVYFQTGRFSLALAMYSEAEALYDSVGNERLAGLCKMNAGNVYRHTGKTKEALAMYTEARQAFEAHGDRLRVASCYLNAGNVQSDAGRHADALAMYGKAAEVFEELSEDRRFAGCCLNIGDVHAALGDREQAISMYHKARAHFDKLGIGRLVAETYLSEARMMLDHGEAEDSIETASEAKRRYDEAGDLRSVALCQLTIGRALERLGNNAEAAQTFAQSLELFESIREEQTDPEMAAGFGRPFADLPSAIARANRKLGRETEAFEQSQRAKGVLLREVVRADRKSPDMDEADSSRLDAAREALSDSQRLVHGTRTNDGEFRGRLRDRDAALAHLSAMESSLRAKYPTRGRFHSEACRLEEIVAALQPGQAILEILVGDEEIELMLVTREGMTIRSAAIKKGEMERNALVFADCLRAADGDDYRPHAKWLHDALIVPIREGLEGVESLVICPDRFLHRIPFGALMDENGSHLIERFNLSSAPSASAWEACVRSATQGTDGNPLVVAVSKFGGLLDLPHIKREADIACSLLGKRTRLLCEDEATVERFRREAMSADHIHIATHALPNDAVPLMSALALSGDAEYLYARDIYQMKLSARLVVLSACGTSEGRLSAGEGVMSFAWAFLIAGCTSVLATQWPVQDEAACNWIEQFYRGISDGNGKAASVRHACLTALSSRFSSPHYWASWVLFGDNG